MSGEAHLTPPGDIEAHLYSLLKPLGGIHVWQFDAGSTWPHVATVASLQVDVRASSKRAARDRAYEALGVALNLPWLPWDAGVVAKVDTVAGPSWEPDPDGAPRYLFRVNVTHRPNWTPSGGAIEEATAHDDSNLERG